MIELADEFDWAFKGVEMAIAMIADMHHAPARGAIPIQHVKFPESEVGVGWPAVGHRIDLRGVPVGLHVLLSAEQKDTKQPCSVLASFLAVEKERQDASSGDSHDERSGDAGIYLQALDPIAETMADPNSYGFRKERSTADAIEQCHIVLSNRGGARWIFEGDIKSCFDRISHEWLMAHIPMCKTILQKWLKAGFMEKHVVPLVRPASVRLCFWFFVEFEGRSCSTHRMPRRPRIEFEGAIYHVMARGNARQRIVGDDHDRERLLDDLRGTVLRCGWELLAFVFMENHLHLLLKTPRPNLARGMQQFLSSYAIWHGRRHRRVGHLFQGRYRAELIEDESYYWTVSRYIHLNPVRAGLVEPGRMAVVELSRLCQAVPPPALGGPRGPAVGLAWRARWNRFSACLPALRGGRSEESSSLAVPRGLRWLGAGLGAVRRSAAGAGRACPV